MSLFEFLYIGHTVGNNRRGLRLPLLLGRLHLGLIFSGPCSSSSGRKSGSEKCTLRSFLFIATVLITKCGSSAFPNRNKSSVDGGGAIDNSILTFSSLPVSSSTSSSPEDMIPFSISKYLRDHPTTTTHLEDHQDYPLQHLISMQTKNGQTTIINGHYIGDYDSPGENVKTLGYVLKGMILPMLISLTLSFGFVIYKNRVKRARLQAIQNSLEAARLNPNQLLHPQPHSTGGGGGNGSLVGSALLSVLDTRGEWSLISGADGVAIPARAFMLEGDDYVGEGGETARHKPYLFDKPPDYASVFDPPSYEQATAAFASSSSSSSLSQPDRTNVVKTYNVPPEVAPISLVENSSNCQNSETELLLPPPSFSGLEQNPDFGNNDDDDIEDDEDNSGNEVMRLIGTTVVCSSLFD